ncbi:hypothetical protein L3Q82_005673 [Scortum barcoo]|uniref:Uncharacterized protein n=1 Tax=Scortum barcoo TaxID=214431 RepID=A0ACB8V7B1_9TELE|nr:hypothetical protein L3Q82_005673 [Scortum barcoo]
MAAELGSYKQAHTSSPPLTLGNSRVVERPEPDITTIVQNFPSDPVRPGDSVTLQCSVLSDYENKTCPGEHSVYWFRTGSDGAHPTLIYVQRNNSDQCEKSPEAHSPQKCVYNFSKNVSSSDAGTYYCAVATCGEILFGDGRKLDIQAVNMWNLKKANGVIILLCASLAISLIVIALQIYSIKKKTLDCNEVCQELRGEPSMFQPTEEEESLLSLLYQVSCVHGPAQVRCDVDAQELDIVDTLNCFPVDEERSVCTVLLDLL